MTTEKKTAVYVRVNFWRMRVKGSKVVGRYRLQGSKEQPVHVKLVLLDARAESSQLDSGLPVVVVSQVKV